MESSRLRRVFRGCAIDARSMTEDQTGHICDRFFAEKHCKRYGDAECRLHVMDQFDRFERIDSQATEWLALQPAGFTAQQSAHHPFEIGLQEGLSFRFRERAKFLRHRRNRHRLRSMHSSACLASPRSVHVCGTPDGMPAAESCRSSFRNGAGLDEEDAVGRYVMVCPPRPVEPVRQAPVGPEGP